MIRFRDVSLRNKIFFSIIGVMLCVSVAIALLARWILISSLTTELEHRGVAIAQAMAERGRGYVLDNDASSLLSLIFDAAELGERKSLVSYVFVSDMDHKVLAHTFVRAFPDELRTANDIPQGAPNSVKLLYAGAEPTYDVAVPMEEGLYQVATVHVGLNKRHIDKLVDKLRTTFLGFLLAAIIIIFLVSLRVSRSITQPLAKLIKMSDEITRGNLSFKL
ncbi:MAG: PAS domain-containing sensor histidine kinase, partial [Thermodesulfobacteriota bacterium]|nr:PAS domain-containing sensor histidine kinase [Thermodesulfobacteriota bacterium]